jgi:hypothetical protein
MVQLQRQFSAAVRRKTRGVRQGIHILLYEIKTRQFHHRKTKTAKLKYFFTKLSVNLYFSPFHCKYQKNNA